MSSSAKVSILETFRSKLKNEWKQRPNCSTHEKCCRTVRHFIRTTLLKEWMAQKENTTCKTNGQRLIDEVNPISWVGTNPKSILEGDKSCILVLSCLLQPVYGKEGNSKEGHGNLIYIFQSAGVIDNKRPPGLRSFEQLLRTERFAGSRQYSSTSSGKCGHIAPFIFAMVSTRTSRASYIYLSSYMTK